MVKHSIVTFDSSFRNFFHLIDSLADQDYNLNHVEVIFVEQRSEATAGAVADALGVESIRQVSERVKDRLPIALVFMNEPDHVPYHPGRLVSEGLRRAQGEILQTMDADILVPPDFLNVLDRVHQAGNVVACLHRHTADRPCGVMRKNWTRQIVDYQLVLSTCPDRHLPIPAEVGNKAPLLSTRKENWEAIQHYDEHRIFSTAYTFWGRDVCLRLKNLLGDVEVTLPMAAVHPWHPTEVNRNDEAIRILYNAQATLMEWSQNNGSFDLRARYEYAEQLYAQYREPIDAAIEFAETEMRNSTRPRTARGAIPQAAAPRPHFAATTVQYVQ